MEESLDVIALSEKLQDLLQQASSLTHEEYNKGTPNILPLNHDHHEARHQQPNNPIKKK